MRKPYAWRTIMTDTNYLASLLDDDQNDEDQAKEDQEIEIEIEEPEEEEDLEEEDSDSGDITREIRKVSSTTASENSKMLPGLEVDKEVPPPQGFTRAFRLKGATRFLGGRKHDSPRNLIALGERSGTTVYIVRTDLHFSCDFVRCSSTQTDEWLNNL